MNNSPADPEDLQLSSYQFELPAGQIAQHPSPQRDGSRLLVVPVDGAARDHLFKDLPDLVKPHWHLVFNNTKVMPARLLGQTPHGGKVELLLLDPTPEGHFTALAKPGKKLRAGAKVLFPGTDCQAEILEVLDNGDRKVAFSGPLGLQEFMDRHGHLPLPPYIDRPDNAEDRERYQTVYARDPGSVAAPTAGLHFTRTLIEALKARGVTTSEVTLQVGPGTFRPVSSDDIREHKMHQERYSVDAAQAASLQIAREEGRAIIAVGTTSVRVLESLDSTGPLQAASGSTDLFIHPGYCFSLVDGLITNFHLPGSSLLMLVSALLGRKRLLDIYQGAVQKGYRFFSYGDAMLIPPKA